MVMAEQLKQSAFHTKNNRDDNKSVKFEVTTNITATTPSLSSTLTFSPLTPTLILPISKPLTKQNKTKQNKPQKISFNTSNFLCSNERSSQQSTPTGGYSGPPQKKDLGIQFPCSNGFHDNLSNYTLHHCSQCMA
jgi:hypothetical protein